MILWIYLPRPLQVLIRCPSGMVLTSGEGGGRVLGFLQEEEEAPSLQCAAAWPSAASGGTSQPRFPCCLPHQPDRLSPGRAAVLDGWRHTRSQLRDPEVVGISQPSLLDPGPGLCPLSLNKELPKPTLGQGLSQMVGTEHSLQRGPP